MRLLNVLLLFLLSNPVLAENRVLELDGQGSYVELPGQIFNGLEAATVEAWVKWEDWAYFSQFFAFGTDGEWRAMGMNHFDRTSMLQFFIAALLLRLRTRLSGVGPRIKIVSNAFLRA